MQRFNFLLIYKSIILLILFIFSINVFSQTITWQLHGPPAGFPYHIYVLSDSSKTILATGTGTSRDIFKTSDNGYSWDLLNNGFVMDPPLEISGILDFTVDENFQNTMYATVIETQGVYHLYRSTDAGTSWHKIYNNILFEKIFARNGFVYATLGNGNFYVSYDAGINWDILAPSPPETKRFVIGKYSGDIFIGTRNSGVYYKNPLDSSFAQIGFNDSTIKALDLFETDTSSFMIVYAKNWDGGAVYISTDKGQNWDLRNTGMPVSDPLFWIWSIKISPSNPNIIYAGALDGIYKTIDQGFNWFPINNGLEIPSIIISEPISVNEIFVHPQNENFVYAGTENKGLFMTSDGGQNWSLIGFPAVNISGISASAQNPELIYAGAALGFYKKRKTWQPTTLIPGIFSGSIKAVSISPIDSNLVLAHYNSGIGTSVIHKTIDGGENWNIVFSTFYSSDIKKFYFDPFDLQRIYAVWFYGLLISDDSGDNWSENYIDLASDLVISPVNNNDLFLLELSGEVQKSTDRGLTWTSIRAQTDTEHTAIEIDSNNPSDIYISTYGIWKSADYGCTWTRLNLNSWVTDLEFDKISGYLYAATYGDGILYTTDGGVTWDTLDVTPNPYFYCIEIGEGNGYSYIYAGSYGSGLFEWKIPVTSIQLHSTENEPFSKYQLLQNYPNPFNNETQINYYLPEVSDVEIEIFSILGQSIKKLISKIKMQAGSHMVNWDGKDKSDNKVSSGVYIYKMSTPKFTKSKKLLLMQ